MTFSTSARIILSADMLTIGYGPGANSNAIDPGGDWTGTIEIKFFYDREVL